MISIIKEDRENYSFLLKVAHHSHDQRCEIAEAIMAEGDSDVRECGDYWVVIPNDDYTTFSKMSDVIHGLMDKYNDKAPAVNEEWHYKFEDLKPVFASEIQGGMDPNDEYYPRQRVDAAICELDAHRLCFDTDRKYYIERYDYFLKKSMAYENRLLHSNYRRCLSLVKYCKKKLAYWEQSSKALVRRVEEADKMIADKMDLWNKWLDRWQELADYFGGKYDDA